MKSQSDFIWNYDPKKTDMRAAGDFSYNRETV